MANKITDAGAVDWETRRSSDGGPRLYCNGQPSEFNISISHSGQWVAVGIARGTAIGIDIQSHSERRRFREMAKILDFGEDASHSQQRFFSHWTLREAIAKATQGSVLTAHHIEAELASACKAEGQLVNAGEFTAMVDNISPDAHLAVVLNRSIETTQCA